MGPTAKLLVSTVSSLAVGSVIGNVARVALPRGAGLASRVWTGIGSTAIAAAVASKCGDAFADVLDNIYSIAKEQGGNIAAALAESRKASEPESADE